MKKYISVVIILLLSLVLFSCSEKEKPIENEQIVNPIDLSFSLIDGDDDLAIENFEPINDDAFIAEEGSTVLEATMLYCMSHDISVSLDSNQTYITEIGGLTQGDYSDKTGWVFSVNGEIGNLSANEKILQSGDKICWQFVDFSSFSW